MRTQSSFSGIETAAGTDNDTKTKEAGELEEKKEPKTVPFFKLFAFADAYDYLLMFVGSVGACIHGTSVPVFFIFFGKLINIIGLAYLFPKEASHKVAKYPHFFCQLLDLIQRLSREGSVNTGNNRSKAKSNARGQDQNPDLNSSLLISLLTSERREGGDLGLEREKHEEGKRESDLVQKKKKKKKKKKKREEEEDIATHRNPTATHREPRLRATTATHDRDLSSFSAYPREVYAVSIVGPLDYSFMTPAKHEEESGSWREDAKLTTMAVSMVELTKMVQMVAELRCEKTGYLA